MHLLLVDNLLLNADHDFSTIDLSPHLGLLSLAAAVEAEHGWRATIFDPKFALANGQLELSPGFYKRMAESIAASNADVVGFTALGCNFVCVVRVAQQLRRLVPEVPILLGGPHATVVHRPIVEQIECFDVVVRNEAERSLPAVLERLEDRDFRDVAGVTFRFRDEIVETLGAPIIEDLDELPLVDYSHYPIAALGLESLAVEAGRGCPFRCTFCSTATFFGRRYRLKSAERLVRELDELHSKFGFTDFKLSHDLFTVNRQKILKFCDAVESRHYRWRCSARMDCVDAELLERMSAAGCTAMYFGVEAGSGRMQRISKKNLDLNLVEPTLDLVAQNDIRATISLITGYPEERREDQDATLDLLGRCIDRPDDDLDHQLHMLTPEPGTALYAEYGDRLLYDGFISDFNFQVIESDDHDLMRSMPSIFLTHHYYPATLPREGNTFVLTIFKYLRYIGYPVLGFLLHFFENRLSVLVGHLFVWQLAHPEVPKNGALILGCITEYLGEDHPAVSLVRHRYLTERLWKTRSPSNLGLDWGYALHPHAMVISQIHDCARLHTLLRAGESYESVLALAKREGRNDVLVVAEPKNGVLRHFRLDQERLLFFRALEVPRNISDLSSLLKRAVSRTSLDALVRDGLLAEIGPAPKQKGSSDERPSVLAR